MATIIETPTNGLKQTSPHGKEILLYNLGRDTLTIPFKKRNRNGDFKAQNLGETDDESAHLVVNHDVAIPESYVRGSPIKRRRDSLSPTALCRLKVLEHTINSSEGEVQKSSFERPSTSKRRTRSLSEGREAEQDKTNLFEQSNDHPAPSRKGSNSPGISQLGRPSLHLPRSPSIETNKQNPMLYLGSGDTDDETDTNDGAEIDMVEVYEAEESLERTPFLTLIRQGDCGAPRLIELNIVMELKSRGWSSEDMRKEVRGFWLDWANEHDCDECRRPYLSEPDLKGIFEDAAPARIPSPENSPADCNHCEGHADSADDSYDSDCTIIDERYV